MGSLAVFLALAGFIRRSPLQLMARPNLTPRIAPLCVGSRSAQQRRQRDPRQNDSVLATCHGMRGSRVRSRASRICIR